MVVEGAGAGVGAGAAGVGLEGAADYWLVVKAQHSLHLRVITDLGLTFCGRLLSLLNCNGLLLGCA